jgi:cation diffusion facilitator CzcD-associated flavoprotein CzcO
VTRPFAELPRCRMEMPMNDDSDPGKGGLNYYDVLVVGAGFAGLCALHRFRQMGFTTRVLEKGEGVGGVWYWNRYPGARVDVHGIEYSFSFSDEIEQLWNWTEVMPTQPELERYLNFVADHLHLRPDIDFDANVTAAVFDEATLEWEVQCDNGNRYRCRFLLAATGGLSVPLVPAIPGIEDFQGDALYTSRYPREGYDFGGKRVGVIGTGSSGVQTIPVIAEQAGHLTVFQRSAAFTRPAGNRPIDSEEMATIKATYRQLRQKLAASFSGTLHVGALTVEDMMTAPPILGRSTDELMEALEDLGWAAPWSWSDIMIDPDANRAAVGLYAELIRRTICDRELAASLVPDYPIGCKRPIHDTGYFEAFNRPNVSLVDLRAEPILEITPAGIQTARSHVDLDTIVFATGFDAITGALTRMGIVGRDGRELRAEWADGPETYLGLQAHGYPNLFMITGPGSPSVHVNVVLAIEEHVDWIARCLQYMTINDLSSVEPTANTQARWTDLVESLVKGTIRASNDCNSWYLGSNVPGKQRKYMTYVGGQLTYRQRCEDEVASGYANFIFVKELAPLPLDGIHLDRDEGTS